MSRRRARRGGRPGQTTCRYALVTNLVYLGDADAFGFGIVMAFIFVSKLRNQQTVGNLRASAGGTPAMWRSTS
jgi:hypothetical protein